MKKFAFLMLACLVASCAGRPKPTDAFPPEETAPVETAEGLDELALPGTGEEPPVNDEPLLAETETPGETVEQDLAAETPNESAEPEEPALLAEIAEPTEPVGQAEIAEPTEYVGQAESAKPVEPIRATEPAKPEEPAKIAEPVKPAEPVRPTEPVSPREPVQVSQNQIPAEEAAKEEAPATETPAEIIREPVFTPAIREAPAMQIPNIVDEPVAFSRVVRATVGQLVEIPFRGTGWVYLGEMGTRRGISYNSRRLDPEGQSFIFQVEAPGVYALKFYKQDFIRNYILNDYVQVIAGEAPETAGSGWFNPPIDRGRVVAEPRWPTSLEEAEIIAQGRTTAAGNTASSAANESTAVNKPALAGGAAATDKSASAAATERTGGTAPSAQTNAAPLPAQASTANQAIAETQAATLGPNTPLQTFLSKAQEEFDAGRIASAISTLDQAQELFPAGSDEAYWLLGQFYEANSPSRNIKASLDYYRRLIHEFPQSSRCNDARRRIAYLERFYINIQ